MSDQPPAPSEPPIPPGLSRVEALFAGTPAVPMVAAGPVIRKLTWLLALGLPLDAAGVLCCTGVPGAVLTLWAWLVADSEVARIDAGVYSEEDAAKLRRLRGVALFALGFCVLSLIIQARLLANRWYEVVLGRVLDLLGFGGF